ncbi:hypothetical protein BDF14DRAFT_478470 [Spinellus fusiger]|nr:hypothetical protein BDF14DRAFT_478470 [Spinellus fusiger]
MNRTPNTTAQTNAKSTPPVFNYAQAAKRSSQNLDQQRPKSNEPKPNGNPRFNGTSTPTAKPNPPSFAAALGKTAPSNTSEMTGNHPTAPAPVAQPDVSIKPKQASVQLPRAPPTDAAPIQFGSINQPIDIPTPSPPKTSEIPTVLQSEVTFGSVNVTEAPVSYYWIVCSLVESSLFFFGALYTTLSNGYIHLYLSTY